MFRPLFGVCLFSIIWCGLTMKCFPYLVFAVTFGSDVRKGTWFFFARFIPFLLCIFEYMFLCLLFNVSVFQLFHSLWAEMTALSPGVEAWLRDICNGLRRVS